MNIAGCVLVYAGILILSVGSVSLLKPLQFLRIRSRKTALALLAIGPFASVLGLFLPAPTQRTAQSKSHLDAWVPEWQFNELHSSKFERAIRSGEDSMNPALLRAEH